MRKITVLSIITLLFVLTTCKSMLVIEPVNDERSIIAISCQQKGAFGRTQYLKNICFAKLDDKNNLKSYTKLIRSTSFDGKYVYLLNAEPGIYAAVSAYFYHANNDSRYDYFFDEKTVKAPLIEVKPHSVNYIGELSIDSSFVTSFRKKLSPEADAIQDFYYYPVVKAMVYYRGQYKYEAGFKSLEVKEKDAFLSKAKDVFKESKWLGLFE